MANQTVSGRGIPGKAGASAPHRKRAGRVPRAAGSARQARRAGGQRDFQPAGKTLSRKNGEETVYRYTCEYLYIKGKKYYVSKKHRYPDRPRPGADENDPENPDNRRLLATRLELRTEIRRKLRERKKLVTLYCGVLNAMKPRRLARLEPAAVLEEAWEAYKRSEEYAGLSAELDGEPRPQAQRAGGGALPLPE